MPEPPDEYEMNPMFEGGGTGGVNILWKWMVEHPMEWMFGT